MENRLDHISEDYQKCKTLEDFESFVLKYNFSAREHPLIIEAKKKIARKAKYEVKTQRRLHPLIVSLIDLFAGLGLIAVAILLINISLGYDGDSAYVTYHGEHVDIKLTNWETLLGGPVCLFGGIACGLLGLYVTIVGIGSLCQKK